MRKAIISAAVIVAAISVAGCENEISAEQLAQIQQATKIACGFVPTAVTVASMFPNAAAPAMAAGSIAKVICDAVTQQQALGIKSQESSRVGETKTVTVTIDGKEVTVKGVFVK